MIRKHQNSIPRDYYQTEIVIVLLTALGIYLIRSDINISDTLRLFVLGIGSSMKAINQFIDHTFKTMWNTEVSDIVGILTIVIASMMTVYRVRKYLVRNVYEEATCQDCGGRLHRIHRTRFQHILTKCLFLDSSSFLCEKCEHSSFQFLAKTVHAGGR